MRKWMGRPDKPHLTAIEKNMKNSIAFVTATVRLLFYEIYKRDM